MSQSFISTGMTPRAWRMISYCVVGFLVYCLLLFAEMLQSFHLNKIDQQLNLLDKEVAGDVNP